MALILPYGDKRPRIGRGVFLAPNATIIGDVEIGDESSIWFGAVLRGDIGPIRIGRRTNVQDLACVHMTADVAVTELGDDVTVGHGAILHGCTVEDRCLIGMGSIIMDGALIGDTSLVAAGAVVAPRTQFPPRSLIRGKPARLVREVNEREAALGIDGAVHYQEMASRYRGICADLPGALPPPAPAMRPAPREGRGYHVPGRERERALDFGNDRLGEED